MRQISYKNKNGWFPEWRISPSTCRRYRDDSQLPAHAQNQRLAVLRLQQQRQQQGRVWQVHRVLQREHLPAWVHLFIILFFFYSVLLAFTLICSSGFTFLCLLTFLHSAPLVSLLFCSFYPPSFLFLSLPSDQIYPIAMLALLSCCIIAKPVTLHRRAGMCVRLCAHLCVCVCPRAVAELLLQIFDRKRLFHPALLHNGFN